MTEDTATGAGVAILTAGSTVNWTYKVTNTGNTNASTVQLADNLPVATSYVSGSLRSGTSCAGAATGGGVARIWRLDGGSDAAERHDHQREHRHAVEGEVERPHHPERRDHRGRDGDAGDDRDPAGRDREVPQHRVRPRRHQREPLTPGAELRS